MGVNFHFRSLQDEKELRNLIDFLRHQDLGYPNYQDWVSRTQQEINSKAKHPILVFDRRTLVAEIIYQKHRQLPDTIEIKNLRVHPEYRKRDFAHFLIKQVEAENQTASAIICDARADAKGIHHLLRFSGYTPLLQAPLYDSNSLDIIFIKTFTERTSSGLVTRAKGLFC